MDATVTSPLEMGLLPAVRPSADLPASAFFTLQSRTDLHHPGVPQPNNLEVSGG